MHCKTNRARISDEICRQIGMWSPVWVCDMWSASSARRGTVRWCRRPAGRRASSTGRPAASWSRVSGAHRSRSVVVVEEGSRAGGVEQEQGRRCCLPCWREEDTTAAVFAARRRCAQPRQKQREDAGAMEGAHVSECFCLPACFRFAQHGERGSRAPILFIGHEIELRLGPCGRERGG